MAPYKALYGWRCRSPSYWDEVGERRLLGPKLVHITAKKARLLAAQSRQWSYASPHWREVTFKNVKYVSSLFLIWEATSYSGEKLSLGYVGLFEVLEKVGKVAYCLALPPDLSHIHLVFHISSLWRYRSDPSHFFCHEPIQIRENLTYD